MVAVVAHNEDVTLGYGCFKIKATAGFLGYIIAIKFLLDLIKSAVEENISLVKQLSVNSYLSRDEIELYSLPLGGDNTLHERLLVIFVGKMEYHDVALTGLVENIGGDQHFAVAESVVHGSTVNTAEP